jgi:hypothetical protein
MSLVFAILVSWDLYSVWLIAVTCTGKYYRLSYRRSHEVARWSNPSIFQASLLYKWMDLGMYWLLSFLNQFRCNPISNCSRFTQHINISAQYIAWSSKIHSSSSVDSTTLVGFGLLSCRWAFSAGRFYWVPLPAARQTPNFEENQGFRAFQLSPQEAPSIWSDASEPSSGRWKYGREMVEKFCRKWRLPRHFLVLLRAVKHDMGQTTLLPLRRKAC